MKKLLFLLSLALPLMLASCSKDDDASEKATMLTLEGKTFSTYAYFSGGTTIGGVYTPQYTVYWVYKFLPDNKVEWTERKNATTGEIIGEIKNGTYTLNYPNMQIQLNGEKMVECKFTNQDSFSSGSGNDAKEYKDNASGKIPIPGDNTPDPGEGKKSALEGKTFSTYAYFSGGTTIGGVYTPQYTVYWVYKFLPDNKVEWAERKNATTGEIIGEIKNGTYTLNYPNMQIQLDGGKIVECKFTNQDSFSSGSGNDAKEYKNADAFVKKSSLEGKTFSAYAHYAGGTTVDGVYIPQYKVYWVYKFLPDNKVEWTEHKNSAKGEIIGKIKNGTYTLNYPNMQIQLDGEKMVECKFTNQDSFSSGSGNDAKKYRID